MNKKKEENEEEKSAISTMIRIDAETAEIITRLSDATKLRKTELVKEAVKMYEMAHFLERIDPKALIVAMSIYRKLFSDVTEFMLNIAKIFSSSLVQSQFEIANAIMKQLETINTAVKQNQSQSQEVDEESVKLKKMVVQQIVTLLTSIISSILLKSYNIQLPSSLSTQREREIPIEIKE